MADDRLTWFKPLQHLCLLRVAVDVFTTRRFARPLSTANAHHASAQRNSALAGTLLTSSAAQTAIQANICCLLFLLCNHYLMKPQCISRVL